MITKNFNKFIIFSPSYSDTNGGAIVLHKLCHELNTLGYQAFLYPAYKTWIMHQAFWLKPLLSVLWGRIKGSLFRRYKTHDQFNTPVFNGKNKKIDGDFVVIYPESVVGNPLNSKYVVRWLLHQPGYHTGMIGYGNNELYFDYFAFSYDFKLPFSTVSPHRLYLAHLPLDLYNLHDALPESSRSGLAYCLRKGIGRPLVHETDGAILIDGLPHDEVAKIFKRIKTFISYDTKTAFSMFAALCGADSVVIPQENVTMEQWAPDLREVYGIAYGFENLDWARSTRKLMADHIEEKNIKTHLQIKQFINDVNTYFSDKSISL